MGRDGPHESPLGALCLGCQTPWQKGEPWALGILPGHWLESLPRELSPPLFPWGLDSPG